jgi:hypothetical protein
MALKCSPPLIGLRTQLPLKCRDADGLNASEVIVKGFQIRFTFTVAVVSTSNVPGVRQRDRQIVQYLLIKDVGCCACLARTRASQLHVIASDHADCEQQEGQTAHVAPFIPTYSASLLRGYWEADGGADFGIWTGGGGTTSV